MYPAKPGLLIGFHGCDKKIRDSVVRDRAMLYDSKNDYDWLGNGMYFWENNPQRALDFAQQLYEHPQKGKKPIQEPAVLGAVIDLGFCLDLMEKEFIALVLQSYDTLSASYSTLGLTLPKNIPLGGSKDLLIRKLDCAVIENLHLYRKRNKLRPFDSARGVFIEGDPVYPTSGFYEKSHIQLCLRNPNCIKGFFSPREENKKWLVP
jgi:hypothetical protein